MKTLWASTAWLVTGLVLALTTTTVHSEDTMDPIADKTLVAWVTLANTTQGGGSVLTLDDQFGGFDGIVFGERAPARWMNGSENFRRTPADQSSWPEETAGPDEVLAMAVTYRGTEVSIYRNGALYARHTVAAARSFPPESAVVMGLRHILAGDRRCIAGTIDEARIYAVALTPEQVAALTPGVVTEGPQPVGWWTFEDGSTADLTGHFPAGKLLGNARIEAGRLVLDGQDSFLLAAPKITGDRQATPLHFRPEIGVMGDPIPFFWKGEYHVFYLPGAAGPVNWEHLVSTDLVHWRQLPTALRPHPQEPESHDGGCMFTGCCTEKDGTFHIFYTGHNPRNPQHQEVVMHATSPDLVTWTKHPEDMVAPDGVHYANHHAADFRDPYVFWNPEAKQYWLTLFAQEAGTKAPVQGLLVSDDLLHWEQVAPLSGTTGQECPDLFAIGETKYLIGGDRYTWAENWAGPYQEPPVSGKIDRPGVYAAKRMFDGRRHVWVGWAWDIPSATDGGEGTWGGCMCLPRELTAGPGGQLYCKPVREVVDCFNRTVLDLAQLPALPPQAPAWALADGVLRGAPAGSPCAFEVPDDYLLDCQAVLEPGATLALSVREQPKTGEGYRIALETGQSRLTISGPGFSVSRPCPVDVAAPVKLQVFVMGTIIECFVNDQYAQTCRVYNYRKGRLGLNVTGGEATVTALTVKTEE